MRSVPAEKSVLLASVAIAADDGCSSDQHVGLPLAPADPVKPCPLARPLAAGGTAYGRTMRVVSPEAGATCAQFGLV
jgi:hypothetical protein